MAAKVKKTTKTTRKQTVSPFNIYWDKKNYFLLIAGVVVSVLGYYLLSVGAWDSTESLVFSPILLFIAYILIFPLSILFRKKEVVENSNSEG
ncbi:MAG: hypothetical protein KF721_09065 [Ignavibacteriaceae bacterium]|nr:hypothetical protein [Ignavibacteriaceae bacterium]HRI48202.1 hypothetical protein [Ignavibacteriaceae bacterium]